ncbi:unnamed protein product (macronuclear) [Paramecium tetraurelia]|uniref:Transmembrane protein n=1 Tax=Paramecium tetraurelia TaxID=5888 RepID=A0BJB6_PARTE|nr:uncharacterized protein GSPATT00005006001 [Paramecium tetraurelia]CAK58633.1 unnamed protein product [Paramecium tetraurelia]|eukprot:XP_001426031.1 hypothetical protein (macronuclear) [Paramecium tetraurelia strain d4-2]
MNIYTLKFEETTLENSYRYHKCNQLQSPILIYTYVLSILLIGSQLIQQLVNHNYAYLIQKLVILLIVILLCLFFKQLKRFPNLILLLINLLLVSLETESNQKNTYHQGYLFGCNQMLTHIILLMGSDFQVGLFTNIILAISRTAITFVNEDALTFEQYLYTIIITVGVSGLLYSSELYQRRSFLYQTKDTTWEKILPFVICKPFLIFKFDKDSFCFQQIAINKSLTESQEMQFDSVGDFLKECKYEKSTLQKYLFQKYEKFNNLVNNIDCEKLEIQYKKSRMKIKLLVYFVDTVRFMIVVETVDQAFIDLKYRYQNNLKEVTKKYNNQIKKLAKILNKKLKKCKIQLVSEIAISILEFRILQSIKMEKLIKINLQQLFQKFYQIFHIIYKYDVYFQAKQDYIIYTYKPELYYFIVSIIRQSNRTQQISFIIDQNQEAQVPQLSLSGIEKLPEEYQFQYCQQTVFEKHIQVLNSHFWIFKELHSSFNQHYTFENISNDQQNLLNQYI